MKEPSIHSHITDGLEEDHPLAYTCVYCDACHEMVHCANNECMQTWVEYRDQAWCLECFGKNGRRKVLK